MLLELVTVAFWAMLPAYVPNNVAVLAGGGAPIDGGRTLGGRRLLGDGKTWRGTAVGTLAGLVLAQVLTVFAPVIVRMTGVALPTFPITAALGLAFGAMLGDITASFLKRRTGRERGVSFPVVDQLDFVAGALGCAALFDFAWFSATFSPPVLGVIVVLTPVLHVGTNVVAYVLGLKGEPY
ncbi:MAG: CDP-2,3-bis-(O-geranylgeranyl)-sn-glycerol synthase [Halobellus sp.]|uniref:CDP-2,3-bis-(O-geranylgeranyl)-sn-glycerol synthase n=1 Tax=Halobellus sp. TaxID=1979212 RepID=UPI0035D44DA3